MDIATHFDGRALHWDDLYRSPRFRDRLRLFVEGAAQSVPARGRILDFGCGTGRIALELAGRGYRVHGVDISGSMLERARANAASRGIASASFGLADAADWHAGGAYDAIVCSSVVEYVPDDEALLRRFAETLVPGGALLVSVPNHGSPTRLLLDAARLARNCIFPRAYDFHFVHHRYTRAGFSRLLTRAGFEQPRWTSFELPVLGSPGVALSRIPALGTMVLARTRRRP